MNFKEKMNRIETDEEQLKKLKKLQENQLKDQIRAKSDLTKTNDLIKWGDKKIKERTEEIERK
jgi:hypothetical protein